MPDTTSRLSNINLQPVLLGVGFALLIAISFATVLLVNRASDDAQRLAQTLNIQNRFANILLSLRRAESSQRGYLFANDENYLDDYRESEPEAKALVAELKTLTRENQARQVTLGQIDALIDTKFKEMTESITLNQSGRREDARSLVISGAGREMTAQLRAIIDDAIDDESRIAAARTRNSRATNNTLLIVTLVGSGLIVLIGMASLFLVQRNHRRAATARQELAVTNANLERIVEFRTADLIEANEEIQRFAYIVSHDLRSPLVNVMGFTSELESLRKEIFEQVGSLREQLAALNAQAADTAGASIGQLGEDFDEAIRFIKTSIGNMDRLINAVLKLSREGRRQFHPEQIDMNALFDSIAQNVSHRAAEMEAELAIAELPPVESDRLALEQIFTNLVDNALKYSRPDEPLKVNVRGSASQTNVVYEVEDNGRGIDAKDHQRVFELFRRSGRQDRPGEGIGLAHVRALVRRLGGTMGLNSEMGKGSTFTVTLPRWWSADNRSAA